MKSRTKLMATLSIGLLGGGLLSTIPFITTSCGIGGIREVHFTANIDDIRNWDLTSSNSYCNVLPRANYQTSPYENKSNNQKFLTDFSKHINALNWINADMTFEKMIVDLDEALGWKFYTLDYSIDVDFHNGKLYKFVTEKTIYALSSDGVTHTYHHSKFRLKDNMTSTFTSGIRTSEDQTDIVFALGEGVTPYAFHSDIIQDDDEIIPPQDDQEMIMHFAPQDLVNVTLPDAE